MRQNWSNYFQWVMLDMDFFCFVNQSCFPVWKRSSTQCTFVAPYFSSVPVIYNADRLYYIPIYRKVAYYVRKRLWNHILLHHHHIYFNVFFMQKISRGMLCFTSMHSQEYLEKNQFTRQAFTILLVTSSPWKCFCSLKWIIKTLMKLIWTAVRT